MRSTVVALREGEILAITALKWPRRARRKHGLTPLLKHSGAEPSPHRAEHIIGQFGERKYVGFDLASSGYAGVWATENTREALFDAMMRKEVYATTGPRMLVRFFGGWDFEAADANSRLPGTVGYTKGVAMGGKLPTVGNTVDVANATWTNTIGDPELITVWKDPDFDPARRAFYYARVIEIPTPRWTAYDAERFGVQMPDEAEMTTTERAYTSPIW